MTTRSGREDDDGVAWSLPKHGRLRTALGVAAVLLLGFAGYLCLQPAVPPPEPARVAETPGPGTAPDASPAEPPDPMERAMLLTLADAGLENKKEISVTDLGKGDGTGIGAFPRPGTKPVLRGLVVPDGFVLPEGYVRHTQATDDGRTLPPILMFHPDYRPLDASGNPIKLPADRIVPPELAPPGMPLVELDAGAP